MSTNYTLAYDQIYDVTDDASWAIKEAKGSYLTSSVGSSFVYDTRNHPSNPNRGLYFQVGSDVAGLGGDVNYVRLQGEGRAYYPITEKITFVGRIIGGHISGWGGEDVRLLDLYYKGGETVRGFERAGYGPRDSLTGDSLGGQTFWAATAEVRFPLPLIPDELGMSGAVFADAGSLFGAGKAAKNLDASCGAPDSPGPPPAPTPQVCLEDSSAIRSSVGVGLLWNSPLGPLRLDYAYALTKEDYDKTQAIRFGASTKF
jgi:outer membrane protein insertion porin family